MSGIVSLSLAADVFTPARTFSRLSGAWDSGRTAINHAVWNPSIALHSGPGCSALVVGGDCGLVVGAFGAFWPLSERGTSVRSIVVVDEGSVSVVLVSLEEPLHDVTKSVAAD